MTSMYAKSFENADEIKTPPKAHVSVVKLGDMNASKMVLEPGWMRLMASNGIGCLSSWTSSGI